MSSKTIKSPAFRYHGGKFRLAPWIIQHFPTHQRYVEPFGGAASVLLQKQRSYAEVYNDLDSEIVNFFRVVRDRLKCYALIEALILTPYARTEFEMAYDDSDCPIERARRTAIRAQMGFGSAGATKGKTGFRIDCKRPYGTAQHNWEKYPNVIGEICQRLQGVLIENRPALDIIKQHDTPETLHYVDPPYLLSTRVRAGGAQRYYRHELTESDHVQLVGNVIQIIGHGCRQRLRIRSISRQSFRLAANDQALAHLR